MTKRIRPAAIVLAALTAFSAETPEVQLQRALQKEAATGDLKAAIETYKKIAASAGSNRAVAAQALLHEAEAHQKLGDAEAQKLYQQIVRQFADQKGAAAAAQARLGGTTVRASGMVNRRVWDSPNASSVSPDGRYLAFTDWGNKDHYDLVLHDLSTGTDRRLTNASKDEYADEAAFSPDGKQIAYVWFTKDTSDLRIISLAGNGRGSPRVFKDGNWNYDMVAWSPDGKWLATVRWVKEIVPGGKVVLVSVQDGSSRVLADACNTRVIFSPDSKYLAYDRMTSCPSSQHDVFIADIAGGRETPVVVYPGEDKVMAWAKDGRLLFASDRSGSTGLWALPIADGKPTGQPWQITSDIGTGYSLGMTSSSALYYSSRIGRAPAYLQVGSFDFNAGRIVSPPVDAGPVARTTQVLEQIDWSPDGKQLAYIAPDGKFVAIRAMETGFTRILPFASNRGIGQLRWAPDNRTLLATGVGQVHLIDTQTDHISTFQAGAPLGSSSLIDVPRWSPDQKKIYFRLPSTGSVAFYESDPDLRNPREIIRRPGFGGLNLTPDGRTIFSFTGAAGAGFLSIPVDGGQPKEFPNALNLGNIFISPDGKYLAFASVPPPPLKLSSASIMPVEGGEIRRLLTVEAPLWVAMGMWAPDSKSVFLRTLGPDGQMEAMWRVPVDGGAPVKVETGLSLDQDVRYVTVSPAGKQIAFTRGAATQGKSEVWMLENFLPPAK